jgi:putative oxidoreductase
MADQAGAGRGVGLLLARICLAALFAWTGFHNVQQTGQTATALAGMGYPAPNILAIVAVAAEIGGAVSLLLGVLTPLGCISLILFLLPTTYSFHLHQALEGNSDQILNCLKNMAIVGGLIALMFSGPGRFSFDGRVMKGGRT